MARLTRRAGLAAAGATVVAALAVRKLAGIAHEPADRAVTPPPPQVAMRPWRDIVPARPPSALPPVTFRTLDGAPAPLSAYAGRPVVLNLWATWCVPCVAELPELDRLAASGDFTVLAASTDRGGAATVRPFVAAHDLTHLTVLLDQDSSAVHALQVAGFPTTLLIGADGRLRGTLEGPAAWSDAKAAIDRLLN